MNPITAQQVIATLGLRPHPLEGGFFCETYRTGQSLTAQDRSLATAIYYLLTPDTFSAMHRLPTDELFHFYLGDPVEQLQIRPDGSGDIVVIGSDLLASERPQVIVRGGVWQGARLAPGGRLALLGATMSPGFAYADYESGGRTDLTRNYPQFAEAIIHLTYSDDRK